MANVNKRDSDSKKHKTVINVRTSFSSGGDKEKHTRAFHAAGLAGKSTGRHTLRPEVSRASLPTANG